MFLINRLPSQVLEFDSPFFRLFKTHLDYHDLCTFGCVCFVHLPPVERHKLGAQSVQCAFMGYSTSHKGFLCYDTTNNRFRISRNVTFFDHQYMFPCLYPVSNDVATLPNILLCLDLYHVINQDIYIPDASLPHPFQMLIRHLNLCPRHHGDPLEYLVHQIDTHQTGMVPCIILLLPLYPVYLFLHVTRRQLRMCVG